MQGNWGSILSLFHLYNRPAVIRGRGCWVLRGCSNCVNRHYCQPMRWAGCGCQIWMRPFGMVPRGSLRSVHSGANPPAPVLKVLHCRPGCGCFHQTRTRDQSVCSVRSRRGASAVQCSIPPGCRMSGSSLLLPVVCRWSRQASRSRSRPARIPRPDRFAGRVFHRWKIAESG